jgi:hypothetical protein
MIASSVGSSGPDFHRRDAKDAEVAKDSIDLFATSASFASLRFKER